MCIHSQSCHCLGCCTAVSRTAAHARQDTPRLRRAPPGTYHHHHQRSLPANESSLSLCTVCRGAQGFTQGTLPPCLWLWVGCSGKYTQLRKLQRGIAGYLCAESAPARAICGRSDVQALHVGAAGVCSEHPDRPAAHPAVRQANHKARPVTCQICTVMRLFSCRPCRIIQWTQSLDRLNSPFAVRHRHPQTMLVLSLYPFMHLLCKVR